MGRPTSLFSHLVRELADSAPLKDATRTDLLSRIRSIHGGLPFAIPLGDGEDIDTVWVGLTIATDDHLRVHLAWHAAKAHVRTVVDETLAEKLRTGEIEVVDTDPDGTHSYRRVTDRTPRPC